MASNVKVVVRDVLLFLVSYILAALTASIFPFVLTYRFLIVLTAKFVRPDLESIVSGMDIVLANDIGQWDSNPEEVVVATISLKSKLSYEKVQIFFEDTLENENFKRLRQYMVPWMGYGFWKSETSFSVENHIFVVDNCGDEAHDDKWLTDFTKKLLKKPFGRMQSPWDIYIVSNYLPKIGSENNSVFIFRHHHALIDGHSCIKLFANAYDNYVPIKYEDANIGKTSSIWQSVKTKLLSPYKMSKIFLNSDLMNIQWENFVGEISAADVKVPVEKILIIRRKYKVGFNPIIFSGIATALRNIFIRTHSKIPEKIHFFTPMPKENHPDRLCNHYTGMFFPLPVGISDPLERLISINADFDRLNSSDDPEIMNLLPEILGRLPYWISHNILKVPVSALVSFFPIGAQNELLGCPIGGYQSSFGIPSSHAAAGLAIFGVINKEHLYLHGTFDVSVVSSDVLAKEIMEAINEHLDSLLRT